MQSPSKEIRFLSKILLNDPRSTICKNVWFLNDLTDVNINWDKQISIEKVDQVDYQSNTSKWPVENQASTSSSWGKKSKEQWKSKSYKRSTKCNDWKPLYIINLYNFIFHLLNLFCVWKQNIIIPIHGPCFYWLR